MCGMENGQWIQRHLSELAESTKIDGKIWRASYTEEDGIGHRMFRRWIEEAGLEWREDVLGNIYGRLPGRRSGTILLGSHIDTVRDGGRYDGAAGVMTALAVLRDLKAAGYEPEYNLEIVGLVEEEGSRFASSCQGSCAICGTLREEDLLEKYSDGVTFLEAANRAGYHPERMEEARRKDVLVYLELHIEQGPLLEQQKKQIGVVENIVGIATYDITITGEQNHAGTTVMALRRDPVVAAARLIDQVTDEVMENSPGGTATFGRVDTDPGMLNVIAGRVHLLLDMRDKEEERLRMREAQLFRRLEALREQGFGAEAVRTQWTPPVAMDPTLVKDIHAAAEAEGLSYLHMNSGAGHDAMVFGKLLPTAMIFIPSQKGISHNPMENTSTEDLEAGFRVLRRVAMLLSAHEYCLKG